MFLGGDSHDAAALPSDVRKTSGFPLGLPGLLEGYAHEAQPQFT